MNRAILKVVIVMAFVVTTPNGDRSEAQSENSEGSIKARATDSSKIRGLPWVVEKSSLRGRSDIDVADFSTKEEADAEAQRLNNENSGFDWIFLVSERPRNQPERTPPPEDLPPKESKTKPSKTNAPLPSRLSGSAFKGKIGTKKVTFLFRSDKPKTVQISGESKETGTWSESNDSIEIETSLAKFRGVIESGRVFGQRFEKNGNGPSTDWGFSLTEIPKQDGLARTQADPLRSTAKPDPDLVGTWVGKPTQLSKTYEFFSDGRFTVVTNQSFSSRRYGEWKAVDSKVEAQIAERGDLGKGSFSRVTDVMVKVISPTELQIDGETLLRVK